MSNYTPGNPHKLAKFRNSDIYFLTVHLHDLKSDYYKLKITIMEMKRTPNNRAIKYTAA